MMKAKILITLLSVAMLSGCIGSDDDSNDDRSDDLSLDKDGILALPQEVVATANITFAESVVDAAVSYTNDLYEPTIEVSDNGVIYITGHTILVDTTGAPVFMSHDDGESWEQLPFLMDQTMPGDLHGATPPPSDEIFLVAGDDGWLYGVDITLATFPVNAWSGDGAELSYHNPNAYDERQVALQASECAAAPAKDRPWVAYADGSILMVSNPAAGPAQIGVMDVPPLLPVGIGATVDNGWWNLCAGPGSRTAEHRIPGIPDMRGDGQFAVPQLADGRLNLILGNKMDIMETQVRPVFDVSSGGEITSYYGQATFDAEGTLFVGISNNTAEDADGNRTGQLRFAASEDAGQTFSEQVFSTGEGAIRHFYMDANKAGEGSLVVWAVDGETDGGYDWYTAHLFLGDDGAPVLENVALAIDEGPRPSAHVTGAAVGPDGRAYLATYVAGGTGSTPLSVWVQQDGPTMPVPGIQMVASVVEE